MSFQQHPSLVKVLFVPYWLVSIDRLFVGDPQAVAATVHNSFNRSEAYKKMGERVTNKWITL